MWKPEGATLVEEEWKPEGAVLIEPTPKKEVTPAPTPITEALTAVEEPTEERPRFEAAPEPSIGQRIKDYFREPQMPVAYDLPEGRKYRTLPPTREEQPLRSLAELGAYGLGQYDVGRALYTPELITERPVEKLVAPISAAEPTPKEKRIGESLKFIGGLRTAGQILGPVIATFPTASQQAIIGGAGVFGLRNITEQLANWARTGKTPSLEAFAKETALGALFGTAEVGLRGFVGFVKGLGNLKKGNVSWTNIKKPQDVADAIKHFQKTGDKSKWEAIRVKYAGITEKGAARIKARAEAIPSAEAKVKEFGKFPLARVGEAVRPPTKLAAAPPVAKVPPEGIKPPPEPTEAKIAAKAVVKKSVQAIERDFWQGKVPYEQTLSALQQKHDQIQADPKYKNPKGDFNIYTPLGRKKLDEIGWAITRTLAKKPAAPTPSAVKPAKEVWEETKEEVFERTSKDIKKHGFDLSVEEVESGVFYQHRKMIKEALEQNKPVPREVLEEYKGEDWAQTELEKQAKPIDKVEVAHKAFNEKYKSLVGKRIKDGGFEWELKRFNYTGQPYWSKVVKGKVQKKEFTIVGYTEKWAQEALKEKPVARKIKTEQLYEEAREYPSAGNFSLIANRKYGISSKQAIEIWKKAQAAKTKPKLVDLGAAKKVKAKEQNFTQFATERGLPSDYDITDHSQLSPSGRRTKRGEAAAMRDLQERINQNKQAHREYREAILAGKIIDPSGKVTKEKLQAAQTEAKQKKVEGRLAQIETQIRFLSDVGRSKRGIRPSYQKQIDALRAERESLRAKPPKAPEVKAVKEIKYEKEAITEPTPSPEVRPGVAEKVIPKELKPTGKLDPTKPEEALKIIRLHDGGVGGIFKTKWEEGKGGLEKGGYVVSSVEYTPEQVDTAYRNVQKPIPSPMPDTHLFAMPGKESQMQAIAKKMQKVKPAFAKPPKPATLTKPGGLPKASPKKEDHIKAVLMASSPEATRYAINGVYVDRKNLVATDGRRLFWIKGDFGKTGLYLDRESLKKGSLGKVAKKSEGTFPKWRDIVPDYKEKPIVIKDLPTAWRRIHQAALITTEESRGITVIANKDGTLGFAASAPEVGHTEINVKPGGKILGGLNPQFLLDSLKFHAIRGDKKIKFYFPYYERPALTRSFDGYSSTITMPINVGEPTEYLKERIGVAEPAPVAKPKPIGKPGFVDIRPILKAHKVFMGILEPSKAVERKQGKEAYAAVIKAIHTPEVGRLEFNQAELTGIDKTIQQLGEWFEQFPDKDLRNLMASRGDPVSVNAQLIKRDAMRKLPKELRTRKVFNAIQQIANFNYKYLQKVVGDDIKRVADYFYGIYKSSKKVDKFLDYWRTTKRFTKEKKLPTVADALDYGLELRNNNPVANLRAEYVAIAHLEGMNWLQEELMRTGKGKFIDNMFDAPVEWEKVYDPIFKDLRVEPDLAKLINNLIASNKITKVPILDTVRQVNNFLRTTKFIGSAFHLLSVAKQSVADSGYLGFLYKPTALRGFTTGFRKYDPIYKTTQYKDYIRHGGGHRYSIESEARRTFTKAVNELNKNFGKAVKAGALPLRVPVTFVNWMFNSYIPKVKYSKYLDNVAETEKKLKRSLKSSEKIDIIKEQQNFYGMMNERLFGRSGTVTTAMRFYFLAPGYAEGNYRTMIKGATQWSGKRGYKANRSRSNMVNSVILTGMLATVGTMIFTGKLPKKPETVDDIRDLFKIDTGRKDNKGRQIMIDLMTYDKDYWNVAFNVLRGRPEEAIRLSVRRIGGMKAPLADMIVDLALVSLGRTVYDWKGDRVTEITDPFLRKVMKYTVHEVKKIEPIPTSVYKTARRRGIDRTVAALETLGGWRPTYSEADRREKQLLSKMYSLRGQREQLSWYIGKSTDPEGLVRKYNKTVNDILDSPYLPAEMRKNWAPKLLIDPEKAVYWKRYPSKKLSVSELRKAINKSTYKKPHKRNGVTYPIGHPHKGKEEYVKSLRAELRKRREKGMLRQ